ncbi:ABC transporter substrate-binding protein [Pseudonocardia sp. GCM10023141]|uniref:ABC transporter substrate-binding protein n=1 Tax=Pseudonocardia sp. GCM10023141 TaxID=3252653 RepID=UPI0036099218
MTISRLRFPAALAVVAAALAACGGAPAPAITAAPATATVTNCGIPASYPTPVQRIVATSNSANVGTLMRIGALRQLAAATLTPGNDAVMSALYGPGIESVPRLKSPISMEAVLAQRPGLLVGSFRGLFAGASGVTIESAAAKGIATYVISDSCRQDPGAGKDSKLGTMDPWDAVRADVTNYGVLTGHQQQASAALAELDTRLKALADAPRPATKPKILLFDSGTNDLYTSGRNGPPQGIIDAAGGTNVFAAQDTTWFHASWESVAQSQPDVIVVMDYRSGNADEVAQKKATITSQPGLKDLTVVAQNRIVVLPLALFTSGFPNIDAADELRVALEGLGLAPPSGIVGKLPADLK